MANDYYAKQEAKRARLEKAAERAAAESEQRSKAARAISDYIPFGQPILVGHHSEKRHRRDLDKIHNNIGKSVELAEKSKELGHRAANLGEHGISSDAPDAIELLKEKLAGMEARSARMKAVNKAHGAFLKKPESLESADLTDEEKAVIRVYVPTYSWTPHPHAPYEFQNLNGNMRRVRARIADLERRQTLLEKLKETGRTEEQLDFHGGQIVYAHEENRVQLFFEKRLSRDFYKYVRSRGFIWAPSNKCFQRQLNGNGTWAAKEVRDAFLKDPHGNTNGALNAPADAIGENVEGWKAEDLTGGGDDEI